MADAANKYSENTSGKYYVDNQCIDCDLCRETAPNNFTRSEEGGFEAVRAPVAHDAAETPERRAAGRRLGVVRQLVEVMLYGEGCAEPCDDSTLARRETGERWRSLVAHVR